MFSAQDNKVLMIGSAEALIDNASLTTAAIDTKDWDYLEVFAYVGTTDIAVTVLKMQESEDSGMSGAADITGLIWGTSADITGTTSTLPTATNDTKIFKFEINLKGRKRYLDLVATFGNGTAGGWMQAFALLSRATIGPLTAAQKGCQQVLRV